MSQHSVKADLVGMQVRDASAMLPPMTPRETRDRFLELARPDDTSVDLAEAALWIAAGLQPDLDVCAQMARIDALAEAIPEEDLQNRSVVERVERLNHWFFAVEGFRGNDDDYYDPRNSFLNDVLDRRVGIPITLSILWIAIARRLGIEAHGIPFPGHFLAAAVDEVVVFVDAFTGRIVEEGDCRALLAQQGAGEQNLEPWMLRPATPRVVLARVLRNLKQVHLGRSDLQGALICSDWMVGLLPDSAEELRDRGLLYRALEIWQAARADLVRYLEIEPGAVDASLIRSVLIELEHKDTRIH